MKVTEIKAIAFNEYGHMIAGEFPEDCVGECSAAGSVDDAVAYWVGKLGFNPPRDLMIPYLKEFGAWPMESDEYDTGLNDMSDEDLAQKVLWSACCDIKEHGEWIGLCH